MNSPNTERRRACADRPVRLLPLALLALALLCVAAHAQQGAPVDSSQAYRALMQHRMEMSNRSVEETQRRRFEEGKSDSSFPSDANKAGARPGVVRASSPEEQKALAHNERGLDLFSKGKLEPAIKEYNEAIRAFPTLAAAHNNLGSAYFAAARYVEAAASFQQAIKLEPDYGQAHFNLALTEIKLGHEREANDALVAATRAYNSTGEAHLKAGRLKEAEESFRSMLQIDPDYAPALLRLGLLCNADRRFEEAAQYLQRVIQHQPTNSDAHESLAESLLGLHKYDEAAAAADRALKLTPDSPGAHYLAGLARASLNQRDLALSHLAKLRQLHSDDYAQRLSDFIDKNSPAKQ
ncbi:MAG: protein O-GlcNAc transferase [Acidobacteriota bacterium]|jgi:tetratricopeptide (TPR) repeat protein|nr:protein O-GlcNAc transferase [Acidobacteriota bacterium]